jgi:hypothetical protein
MHSPLEARKWGQSFWPQQVCVHTRTRPISQQMSYALVDKVLEAADQDAGASAVADLICCTC